MCARALNGIKEELMLIKILSILSIKHVGLNVFISLFLFPLIFFSFLWYYSEHSGNLYGNDMCHLFISPIVFYFFCWVIVYAGARTPELKATDKTGYHFYLSLLFS